MRIIFLSKKKEEKHMQTIEKFAHMAIANDDLELGYNGVDLMKDIFGIKGLLWWEKRLEELQKEIKAEGSKE